MSTTDTDYILSSATTFEKAFTAYLASLSDKKNTKRMIFDGMTASGPVNAEWIQDFIKETEERMSQKTTMRLFDRILRPAVTAIRQYYGIIDTMCQANPFPAAIIWGALKIIFDCADRFSSLFETIQQQVHDLTFHLERINYFDELYKDSSMQSLLCRSYITVLRFWARVRKECERNIYLYDRVKQWLSVRSIFQDTLEADYRRHSSNRANHVPGTSEWLFQTTEFQEWSGESPKSPILWLSGNPGTGKSMLCSRVIQHVQDTDPSAAIAFHFFRFDQECSTIDLLRVMTGQLLESLRQSTKDVPDSILSLTETLGASVQNVMDMMRAIASSPSLPRTFLFIDGLDEELSERRWVTARETLQLLIALVTINPGKSVRLWLSSQPHNTILKTMEKYPRIHLVDQNESDIRLLFETGMQELEQELDDIDTTVEEREHWFELLKEKAKGNFLWAHYMIHSITEEAESIADIEHLIHHFLPRDLNEYYRRQFKRIPASNRNLASKIFSIVCFSRRLVSASELSDAIGKKMGLEFVKNNPDVLSIGDGVAEDVSIGTSILADVCLQYLSQPRYSSLLEKVDGGWKLAGGDPLDKDAFLRYTAKYWYLHLEDVSPSTSLAQRVSTFLRSSNFQTLLQVQHLYVDRQFGVFTLRGKPCTSKFFKRALPHCMRSKYAGFSLCTGDQEGIRTTKTCYEGYSASGRVVHLVQFKCRAAPNLYFICETWYLDGIQKPKLQQRQTLEVHEEVANWKFFVKNEDTDVTGRSGRAKPVAFDYDARGLRIGSQLYKRDENGVFQKIHVDVGQKKHFPTYLEEFLIQGKYLITASRGRAPVPSEERLEEMVGNPVLDVGKLFEESSESKTEDDSDGSEMADIDQSSSESDESDTSLSSAQTGIDWSSGDETWSEGSTDVEEAIRDENAVIFFRGYIDDSSSSKSESELSASDDNESEADSDSDGLGATPYSRFLRGFMDDDSDGDDAYVPIDDSDGDSDGGLHLRSRYGQTRFFRKRTKSALEACLRVFNIYETGLTCIFQLSRPIDLLLYDSPPVLYPFKPLIIWPMSPGNVLFADFENKTWFRRKLRPTTTFTRQVFTKCRFSPCGKYLHIAILEARRKPSKEKKSKRRHSPLKPDLVPLELSLFVTTHRLSSRKTTRAPPTQIYRTKIDLGPFRTLPVSQFPFALTWTPSQLYFTVSTKELTVFKIKLFPPHDGEESEGPVLVPRESVFLPATAKTREVRFFPSLSGSNLSESESKYKDKGPMRVLIGSQIRSSRVLLGEGPSTSNPDSAHNGEGGFQVDGTAWIPQSEAVRGVEGSVSMPVGFYIPSERDFGGWIKSDDIVDVPADRGVGRLDSKVERFDVEEDCDLEPYII
ncbi:hypothetical protein BDV10DRAFT_185687 [Aspergillus recurvatus]